MATTRKPPNLRRHQLVIARCKACDDLDHTPIFLKSLTTVRTFKTAVQAQRWYHQNGHAVSGE